MLIPCLNEHPRWIAALADLTFRNLAGWLAQPPDVDARGLTQVRAKAMGAKQWRTGPRGRHVRTDGRRIGMDRHHRDDSGARDFLRGLARNVRCGGRVCILAAARTDDLAVSWSQLAALIGLSVVLLLAEQMVQAGLGGRFVASGLPYAVFGVPLVLLASWAVASLGRRSDQTLALMIVTLSAALWISALVWVMDWAVDDPRSVWTAWLRWGLYYLPPFWLALVAAVAGARMIDLPLRWRGAAVVIALAVIALPMSTIWIDRRLWAEPRDEETAESRAAYNALAREDAFYQQPKLLERELAGVLPRLAGHPNLFLISVAGYANQDVFMREAKAVDELFAERFGTRGHSIRLINNRKTVLETPIASRTALAESLKRVGAVMNRDEDVLFLFLTSHGSRDQKFSMQFPPLQLADLTPPDLRRMLDDAGIRHRVVVVSSCYSGGFVEALKDDDTLVITASAPDRNSFGCSNEADFTYFGKAYFDEALRTTDSFIEAFDIAVPKIAAREKKEDTSRPTRRSSSAAALPRRSEACDAACVPTRTGESTPRSGRAPRRSRPESRAPTSRPDGQPVPLRRRRKAPLHGAARSTPCCSRDYFCPDFGLEFAEMTPTSVRIVTIAPSGPPPHDQ